MRRQAPEVANNFRASFLSYEKDMELIIDRLFNQNKLYGDYLKRLLVINQPDCLTANNAKYDALIKQYSVRRLMDEGYVRLVPRLDLEEHESIKSFIIVTMDDFIPTSNEQYMDCTLSFFTFSEYEHTKMDNYQYRPIKIAGYINGVMNNAKLTNIGKTKLMGAQQVPLNEYWGGMCLMYSVTHGDEEDKNPDIQE